MKSRQERRLEERQKSKPVVENSAEKLAQVKAWDLPFYRQKVAEDFGNGKKLCIVTYGGLGDVLCAEPTIRYAVDKFIPSGVADEIYVVTRFPQLLAHLPVKTLNPTDGKMQFSNQGDYHFLYCGFPEGNLQHLFFTHNNMLPLDYPALSALRQQLPLEYRMIQCPTADIPPMEDKGKLVYVHAGAHWASKKFPKEWWDDVLNHLCYRGYIPVLIGGGVTHDPKDLNPGTVDVNTAGCIDLRGKLSLEESATHLKNAKVLLTNDSFPLHLATIGHARIGFLATAKDPEWLYHFRRTEANTIEFGWRMANLALGGAYQRTLVPTPNQNHLSEASPEELAAWLPKPKDVADWVGMGV